MTWLLCIAAFAVGICLGYFSGWGQESFFRQRDVKPTPREETEHDHLIGALIYRIRDDGCMAHNHVIEYRGICHDVTRSTSSSSHIAHCNSWGDRNIEFTSIVERMVQVADQVYEEHY